MVVKATCTSLKFPLGLATRGRKLIDAAARVGLEAGVGLPTATVSTAATLGGGCPIGILTPGHDMDMSRDGRFPSHGLGNQES
jgi:hypothetical protein